MRTAIPSPEVACVIIADEVVGLASRPEPDYALLGLALEMLGLCDVSIGAASPAVETDTLSAVLSRADEALYEAKRAGRGRAVRF